MLKKIVKIFAIILLIFFAIILALFYSYKNSQNSPRIVVIAPPRTAADEFKAQEILKNLRVLKKPDTIKDVRKVDNEELSPTYPTIDISPYSEIFQKSLPSLIKGELPSPPDPLLMDKTIKGVDSNNNGIRDEVEIQLHDLYFKDYGSSYTYPVIVWSAWRLQQIIENTNKFKGFNGEDNIREKTLSLDCLFSALGSVTVNREESWIQSDLAMEIDSKIDKLTLSTEERKKAYDNALPDISGGGRVMEEERAKFYCNIKY